MTIRALVESDRGIAVVCQCSHRTALLPDQLSRMAHPETQLLDFKRRFRCSMCGRSGASEEIRMRTFAVSAPFAARERTAPRVRH
jgi:hypothetical protein